MAIPDGVCRWDGVGAAGRSKGEKHPSNMNAGRDSQSKKLGGKYVATKASNSGSDSACPARKADGTANLGTKTQHFNMTTGPKTPANRNSWPGEVRSFQDGVSKK